MTEVARPVRYRGGVPIYGYRISPEVPPVSVLRFDADVHHPPGRGRPHIHEFPVLIYIDRAAPTSAADARFPARDGDVYVLAAGAVMNPDMVRSISAGCGLFFDPVALGGDGLLPWSSWRSHPLLFPFLHGIPGGLLRLHVPPANRPMWTASIAAIERELAGQEEGYRQAALAHLTLLLVDVVRLATDVVGDLRRSNETLLATVFDVIEKRFAEPLSLRDVAAAVGLTPGHLTTLVRKRTGRTIVDWITERRMAKARQLLTETDLPVNEIARRCGLSDPGYFARVFRNSHGVTPRVWRRNTTQTVARQPETPTRL